MPELSETQLQALRWIDTFPSTSAAWTVNGAPIKRQHPDKWNFMEIKGKRGSILVHKDDLKVIRPFVQHLTDPDKLYALNDAGRAAIAAP